jgi:glyoxylase-like metal-dependent hydrolase (beta-lactamase superfamily II)
MKFVRFLVTAFAGALLLSDPGRTQAAVDRLYILDCGHGYAADQSRWSPGVNVGRPLDFSDNCYLIHHAKGYLLWDTGVPDQVADLPDGFSSSPGAPVWRRPRTLLSQLTEIGVAPADIGYVAISHTHPDHVGNVELFPTATLLIQKAEYEWTFKSGNSRIAPNHPVDKLEGDRDVFGDGSVTIISAPGHTPGHQVLLVHLPKTGWIVLSGDAVHFKDNWDKRRVPSMNVDKEQSLASMQRIADLLEQHQAQLWINHDKVQTDQQRHAPAHYE